VVVSSRPVVVVSRAAQKADGQQPQAKPEDEEGRSEREPGVEPLRQYEFGAVKGYQSDDKDPNRMRDSDGQSQ